MVRASDRTPGHPYDRLGRVFAASAQPEGRDDPHGRAECHLRVSRVAWEIATKVRLGKFPETVVLEASFLERIRAAGYLLRSITASDALRAGRFVSTHKDPFDRMIAAQALADDIPVISADAQLDQFGVRRIW